MWERGLGRRVDVPREIWAINVKSEGPVSTVLVLQIPQIGVFKVKHSPCEIIAVVLYCATFCKV